MKTFLELYDELNEKPKGLYYNINKKRKEGRKMRKKGEKGAPKANTDFEDHCRLQKRMSKKGGQTDKRAKAKEEHYEVSKEQSAKQRDMQNRQRK